MKGKMSQTWKGQSCYYKTTHFLSGIYKCWEKTDFGYWGKHIFQCISRKCLMCCFISAGLEETGWKKTGREKNSWLGFARNFEVPGVVSQVQIPFFTFSLDDTKQHFPPMLF